MYNGCKHSFQTIMFTCRIRINQKLNIGFMGLMDGLSTLKTKLRMLII